MRSLAGRIEGKLARVGPYLALVDDDESVRVALGRLLRLASYEVVSFESGEAFLASLAARIPSCALLDVHMPSISGFEVQARLRAARIAIPVVFISASHDGALVSQAAEAGGTALLQKPFSNETLLASVAAALGAD